VGLVEADFRNVADVVLALPESVRALLWMAPPSARRVPWALIEAVLGDPAIDLLLRFPTPTSRSRRSSAAPSPTFRRSQSASWKAAPSLLGDARHEWVFGWRAAEREGGRGRALEGVLERFRTRLEWAAEGRVLKGARVAAGEMPSRRTSSWLRPNHPRRWR
jgi:hypothetical protein